jgi:glycosyltransferase involved in cell wall biosynthesis
MRAALSLVIESSAERWSRILDLGEFLPQARWASFDRTPWQHPWMTSDNIASFRDGSNELLSPILAPLKKDRSSFKNRFARSAQRFWNTTVKPLGSHPVNVGFLGNMANLNYSILSSLRRRGFRAPLYTLPGDNYLLGRPEWEEFDGELLDPQLELRPASNMRPVQDVFQPEADPAWYLKDPEEIASLVTAEDVLRLPSGMPFLPIVKCLDDCDVLVANQVQYLAYLSRRPYVFIPSGGEFWHEPSRDDEIGRMQMLGARHASAIVVSNPIQLAHMRRYGLRNAIQFPRFIDDDIYSPGPPDFRSEWGARIGGDFFVMISARIDDVWKGSQIALEGFAKFTRAFPSARLVVIGWGQGENSLVGRLDALGIRDKSLILPLAGKRRLIRYLRSADCLVDQFVLGYYGGTALEAMACGIPVIMRLERAQYNALLDGDSPPTLDAETSEAVAGHLLRLAADRNEVRRLGVDGRAWFLRSHSASRFAEPFLEILRWLARGNSFDFSRSPLCSPLSKSELDYLADQLAHAPIYPNYV